MRVHVSDKISVTQRQRIIKNSTLVCGLSFDLLQSFQSFVHVSQFVRLFADLIGFMQDD